MKATSKSILFHESDLLSYLKKRTKKKQQTNKQTNKKNKNKNKNKKTKKKHFWPLSESLTRFTTMTRLLQQQGD